MLERTWAVIEQAGHIGENVRVGDLPTYRDAARIMHEIYDVDEIAELHVDIAWVANDDPERDNFSYDY